MSDKPRYSKPRYDVELVFKLGNYIKKTKKSIRVTAKEFGLTKSTVGTYVSKYLKEHDFNLYEEVQSILRNNLSEAPMRAGNTTKAVYMKIYDRLIDEIYNDSYMDGVNRYCDIDISRFAERLRLHRNTTGKKIRELMNDGKIELVIKRRSEPSTFLIKY